MKNQIIILGTGAATSSVYKPFDYRHPAGYLLQHNNKNILIDCSEGIRFRLESLKIDFFSIDDIFISHFHPDHFDLETFVQAVFVKARNIKKEKSLTVYGPKNIKESFNEIWDLKHFPGAYEKVLLKTINIKFFELQDGTLISLNNTIRFTPYNVFHQGGLMDCYAFNIKLLDKTLTYSGDSGNCNGLVKAAENTDIFICESNANIGQDNSSTVGHLNPYQVGLIAKNAGVKHVILTHYTGKDSQNEMKEEVSRSGFKGKISIAKDFQTIPL